MSHAAVIGLGYVGLPLLVHMAEAGHHVVGLDTSTRRIQQIQDGQIVMDGDYATRVQQLLAAGRVVLTDDYTTLTQVEFVSICVPTPLDQMKTPDLQFVQSAGMGIARNLQPGQTIILESTTYPGTTAELLKPVLESMGLQSGEDFYLGYSPERVDPGNKQYTTQTTPKVVGADDPISADKIVSFYSTFIDQVVPVSSTRAAEMSKLLENTFRAVNIAFINELAIMCERLGVDVWEVIDAAKTKPFGFMPFYPGPGIGGHCIPLDPLYLSWKAKSVDFFSRFIDAATDINQNMPRHVVERLIRLLSNTGIPLQQSKVLLLGLTYKPDISDYRESPSLHVFNQLLRAGVQVEYNDPYVPELQVGGRTWASQPIENVTHYQCVVALVAHADYDFASICRNASLVFDTRNVCDNAMGNVIRLGDGNLTEPGLTRADWEVPNH